MKIYTIGHSTLDFKSFYTLLKNFDIQILVDVRSYPGSKYVPHFNKEIIASNLRHYKIAYLHLISLGGRRKSNINVNYKLVDGWQNKSFKNYASYTLTDEYALGIKELLNIAWIHTCCIMCSESLPWKCHRSLIANNLVDLGIDVFHIMSEGKIIKHELNKYGAKAIKQNGVIIYPKE